MAEQCPTGCNMCNSCQTCLTYCQLEQNSSNNFSFSACVSSGEIIGPDDGYFNRDVWNEAIEQINSVFSKGIGGKTQIGKCTDDLIIYAEEFERVANVVAKSSGEVLKLAKSKEKITEEEEKVYSSYGITTNDVIYGRYYEDLALAIANLQYNKTGEYSGQCDSCNSGCDSCNSSCNSGDCNDCCNCCDVDCCDNDTCSGQTG